MFISSTTRSAVLLAMCAGMLALSGCESMMPRGKKIDYKASKSAPDLQIPPSLSTPTYDDRFVAVPGPVKPNAGGTPVAAAPAAAAARTAAIPGGAGAAATAPPAAAAPATPAVAAAPAAPRTPASVPSDAKVRATVIGKEPVLIADLSPDAAWKVAQEFWNENGLVVVDEQPALGIMETDWAENLANLPNDVLRRALGGFADKVYESDRRDKFRTRIERGIQPGSVEIYVTQYSSEQVPTLTIDNSSPAGFVWAMAPPDLRMRNALLQRLMVKLGASEEAARQALAGTTTAVAGHARLENTAEGTRLVVDDDFEGAWRRIGLALDRGGFNVVERDKAKGLIFVRPASQDTTPKKEKSWLSWLKFWPDRAEPAAERYRVLVNPAKGETVVSVQSTGSEAGGRSDNSETLLRMLRDQLT